MTLRARHGLRWMAGLGLAAWALLAAPCGAQSARVNMAAGRRAYEQAASAPDEAQKAVLYAQAASNFLAAAVAAAAQKLDPAPAYYDQGNALYRQGRLADARAAWEQALRTSDLALQAQSYYNQGTALFRQLSAQPQPEPPTYDQTLKALDTIMELYEKAMLLNPAALDYKVNYEIVQRTKAALIQARMTITGLLDDSRRRVKQGQFAAAQAMLEKALAQPLVRQVMEVDKDLGKKVQEVQQKFQELIRLDQETDAEIKQGYPTPRTPGPQSGAPAGGPGA